MSHETLTKAQITHFAGLLQPEGRQEAGAFLAHGRKVTEVAVASGWPIELVVVSENYRGAVPKGPDIAWVSEAAFHKLSDQPNPEGILAVVTHQPMLPALPLMGPALLAYQLNDPGNLGALLRTAAWFGFRGVWLSPGSTDPFGPKAVRGAMGAHFQVACAVLPEFEAVVTQQAQQIVAATLPDDAPAAEHLSLTLLCNSDRSLLLLGSESHGVPPSLLSAKGIATVSIPPQGATPPESLNVAVAAGILCYALTTPR